MPYNPLFPPVFNQVRPDSIQFNPSQSIPSNSPNYGLTEWVYNSSTDSINTISASNYFSNALALGMKVGDFIWVQSVPDMAGGLYYISSITANGANLATVNSINSGAQPNTLTNYRPIGGFLGQFSQTFSSNTTGTATATERTSRLPIIPTFSTQSIVLVFANYTGVPVTGASQGENPGAVTQNIEAALEYQIPGNEDSETGVRIPVTFQGGNKVGVMNPGCILYSDPIFFTATVGTPFYVRTAVQVPGSGYGMPLNAMLLCTTGLGSAQTAAGVPISTGAGATNTGNQVMVGVTTKTAVNANAYPPVAILGYSTARQKSLGIIGDSICAGSYDTGLFSLGAGYQVRNAMNQYGRIYTYPITPNCGHIWVGKSGDRLEYWAVQNWSDIRGRLCTIPSTISDELGTNDYSNGDSLATMQANQLLVANWFLTLGKRYIKSTILPRTTSTDGWKTSVNQTPNAFESVRLAFNTWLRNTGPSGFAQQTVNPANVFIYDAAFQVEVDINNIPTINGGYWQWTGPAILSSTVTSATTSQITDTTQTWGQDQWRGYSVLAVNGPSHGQVGTIFTSDANLINFTAFSVQPNAGNTYEIGNACTVEGTHPTTFAHMKLAAAFPSYLIV